MVYFKFEFGWGRNEKKSSSQVDNSFLRGWEFVNSEVKKAKAQGKYKTASNYLTAVRSWSKFLKSEEWRFTEMTADNLVAYQHWLGENNVSLNTISAYMRALRALYHRVMGHEGNLQVVNPFAKVSQAGPGLTNEALRKLTFFAFTPCRCLQARRLPWLVTSSSSVSMPWGCHLSILLICERSR